MDLALENPSSQGLAQTGHPQHDVSRPGRFNGLAGILEPLEAGVQGLYRTTR